MTNRGRRIEFLNTTEWHFADLVDEYEKEGMEVHDAHEAAYERIEEEIEYTKEVMNVPLEEQIVVIADMGYWNGREMIVAFTHEYNLRDCIKEISKDITGMKYWVDERQELKSEQIHHDSSHCVTYRKLKAGLSDQQVINFQKKLASGNNGMKMINRYTEKLGKYCNWS